MIVLFQKAFTLDITKHTMIRVELSGGIHQPVRRLPTRSEKSTESTSMGPDSPGSIRS